MSFILYSLNYSPELTGIGKYNGELAAELVKRGIKTSVVTAPPYYPEWQVHAEHINWWSRKKTSYGVDVLRSPLYVPSKVSTIKRLLHLFSFAATSSISLFKLFRSKPNYVFLVQPTLFCAPAVLLFCRLTGAKSVMHIQDFEIDAMFGLGMAKKEGKIAKHIKKAESGLLKRFDLVSSISYSMLDNAREKGVASEKLVFFPNWADTDFVTPEVCGLSIRESWGFLATDKVVLYSGNVGKKQGLDIVLEAAKAFANQAEIKFLVIGSGAYRTEMEAMANKMNLTNLFFKPLQPWEDVPQILAMADVHLVVQKHGAADAVLPSKLTNILSAGGHALVTADPDTELGRIAENHPEIYHCVEPENTSAFIKGLTICLQKDTKAINTVAREYAMKNINIHTVIDNFVKKLHEISKFKYINNEIDQTEESLNE
jgi:colanic acid biosynthesis glycosyl transferase WcaI